MRKYNAVASDDINLYLLPPNNDTVIYQIQALGRHGVWDSCNVDSDPDATDFSTLAEAEAELENLVNIQGRDRATLRIMEVR